MAKYQYQTGVQEAPGGEAQLIETDNRAISETRLIVRQLEEVVQTMKWKGRSGMSNKLIMHAHLEMAYEKNSFEYHASCRHLGLIAGVTQMTAMVATKRLIDLDLLVLTEPHEKETFFANKYLITMQEHILQLPESRIPIHSNTTLCIGMHAGSRVSPNVAYHIQTRDVFWNGVDWKNVQLRKDMKTGEVRPAPAPRLGRRSGDIYHLLLHAPATSSELQEIVGCHISTVQRSLAKMQKHSMVFKGDDRRWRVNGQKQFSEVEQELHLLGKHHEQYMAYLQDSEHQVKYVTDEEYRAEQKKLKAEKKQMRQSLKKAIRESKQRQQKGGK